MISCLAHRHNVVSVHSSESVQAISIVIVCLFHVKAIEKDVRMTSTHVNLFGEIPGLSCPKKTLSEAIVVSYWSSTFCKVVVFNIVSLKVTLSPLKWMVGRLLSCEGLFSGANC